MGEFCCRQWCARQSHPGVFKTPIHQAAQMGSFQCLKMFVRHSPSSVIARDGDNKTPSNYASKHKKITCWKLLIATQFVHARIGGFSLATHARIMKWCHKAKQRVEYFRGCSGVVHIIASTNARGELESKRSSSMMTDDIDALRNSFSNNSHLLLLHSTLGRNSTSNTFLGNEIVVSGFNHGKLIKKCPCKHTALQRPSLSRRNTQNKLLGRQRRRTRTSLDHGKDGNNQHLGERRYTIRPSINNTEDQIDKHQNNLGQRRHTRATIEDGDTGTNEDHKNDFLVQSNEDESSKFVGRRRHTRAVIDTRKKKVLPAIQQSAIGKLLLCNKTEETVLY